MVMKECCGKCGFPKGMKRETVFIDSNIFSFIHYEENKCEECGHQSNGSTISSIHKHWTDMCHKFHKERRDLINFLRVYERLDKKERMTVCIRLPKFMKPNYKLPEGQDASYSDIEEPYSWNVVMLEILGNTALSKVMVRDIDWDTVSAYINGDTK